MAAALLIAAALAVADGSVGVVWDRTPIGQVVIEAPGAASVAELERLLALEKGEPLSRTRLRAGVQALIASGLVEDVVVTVADGQAGAAVLVRAQVASRIRSIEIVGLPARLSRRVARTFDLSRGAPLRLADFETALGRATRLLRDDGYPLAELDPSLDFDVAGGTVAVRAVATLGPPLTAARLRAEGLAMPEPELRRVTGLDAEVRLSSATLARARRRLTEQLRRDGFWDAEVDPPVWSREPDGRASVSFKVARGPSFALRLEGIERSRVLEREVFPFLHGDEPFDEAATDQVVKRLRLELQRRGHLGASVEAEVVDEAERKLLWVRASPGPVLPIVAVRFPGATALPVSLLELRIGARPGHPWRWGGEPIDEDTLAADVASLVGTLREAGFAEARVEPVRIVPEARGIALEFPIEEGGRRLVERLEVEGLPDGVSAPATSLLAASPWSLVAQAQAVADVEMALREAGYPDARAKAEHECSNGYCAVRIAVVPGARAVLGTVVVAGLARTSLDTVTRVAALREGAPVGPAAQLEAQRRLLGLGIFERVSVRTVPGHDGDERRGLLLDLDEGPSRAYSFGLGWDTEEKTRVSLSWSELNLFGRARSLFVDTRVSSREQHFLIGYREPARLGVRGIPTGVSVYRTEENFPGFSLLRRGMWLELGDRQRRPGRAILRYDYQIVEPDAPADVLSTIERDQQNLRIASISPIVEWDTRDDIFAPRRGLLATAQLQSAFEAFLADASFDKLTGGVTFYQPLGGGVLASTVRGGAIRPRDDCSGACEPENLRIPIGVRFFAGGRVSHRAFETDELGMPGTRDERGNPLGGGALVLTSLEWRFPVLSALGGSLFVDGGNVWPEWDQVHGADMRWGAGLGVRVQTPVGPLRLEYGWKLDREPGESRGELLLSFGNPF